MVHSFAFRMRFLAILVLITRIQALQTSVRDDNGVKTAVFLSPRLELEPGSVSDKYYYNVDFPRGHIALKSFTAELIDETGKSVPLHETYLHHWVVLRYYQRKGAENPRYYDNLGFHQSDYIRVRNSGICDNTLSQYYGLGSETRRTATHVPDPYGIEVGDPADIPHGFEERWLLNVHAIDTRGVEDRMGCTECRCDLYNITKDSYGQAIPSYYGGGLSCCFDETRCRVKEGFQAVKRGLYLRYTVKYVDWDTSLIPVKIYIFDVTDTWKRPEESDGLSSRHRCLVEYEVESCPAGVNDESCIHIKKVSFAFPKGGDVIYGVAHQHAGGLGSTLYGEDGRVICSSNPIYGEGKEAGDEEGYIVGMTTCYPPPGSLNISDGELLTLVSAYSSAQRHTGVMGLFYILVADRSPNQNALLHTSAQVKNKTSSTVFVWGVALLGIAVVVIAVIFAYRRTKREDGYETLVI